MKNLKILASVGFAGALLASGMTMPAAAETDAEF
jgi:hypothetical protein